MVRHMKQDCNGYLTPHSLGSKYVVAYCEECKTYVSVEPSRFGIESKRQKNLGSREDADRGIDWWAGEEIPYI